MSQRRSRPAGRPRRRRPGAGDVARPDGGRRPPAVVVGRRRAERRVELLHAHERALTPLLAADDTGAAVDAFAALQVVRRRLRAARAAPGARAASRRRSRGRRRRVPAAGARARRRPTSASPPSPAGSRPCPACSPRRATRSSPACPPPPSRAASTTPTGLLDLVGDTARAFAAVGRPRRRGGRAVGRRRRGARGVPRAPAGRPAPAASGECGAGARGPRGRAPLGALPRRAARGARRLRPRGRWKRPEALWTSWPPRAATPTRRPPSRPRQAAMPARDELVAAYARAVAEARAYVVEHDIAGLPAGEELEVMATPAVPAQPAAVRRLRPARPVRRRGSSASTTSPRRRTTCRRGRGARPHARPRRRVAAHDRGARGVPGPPPAARAAPTGRRRSPGASPGCPDGGNILVEGWAFYCEELMDARRASSTTRPCVSCASTTRSGAPAGSSSTSSCTSGAWTSTRRSSSWRARRG